MTARTSNDALANAAGQGINIALGNQRNFSWSSVAGAAVEAGVSDELQDPNSIDAGNLVNTTTGGNLAYSSAVGLVSGASAQGAQVLLSGHGQIQFASIAANSFGQALGSSLSGQLQSTPGETQAAAVATTTAIAPLGGDAGQPFAPLPQIPSYADEGDDVDALIAENAGNTISEDDPVMSGTQQVADRYNQLSASYGDTTSLTAASYASGTPTDSGSLYENGQVIETGQGVTVRPMPAEIEDDLLESTPLSISPLTNDSFSGPSLDADALIQDGADLPLNIGNAEVSEAAVSGEQSESALKQAGEFSENAAKVFEGFEKAFDFAALVKEDLADDFESAGKVAGRVAKLFDLGSRAVQIGEAPVGKTTQAIAGQASDFALGTAFEGLGISAGSTAVGLAGLVFFPVEVPAVVIGGGALLGEWEQLICTISMLPLM